MKYIVDTPERCAEMRVALAKAEGLPRRATVVGGPDALPATYAPGAPGWTDHVVEEPLVAPDRSVAALAVTDLAEEHLGKIVSVEGKAVDLPAKEDVVTELPKELQPVAGKDPVDDSVKVAVAVSDGKATLT